MKLEKECIDCIKAQAERVIDIVGVHPAQKEQIRQVAAQEISKFSFDSTPPHNATPMYEAIAKVLATEDIYECIKAKSSAKARGFESLCRNRIRKSNKPLFTAAKIAVAGNVIDLASEVQFDLKAELDKVLKTRFAIDDFKALQEKLETTKTLAYLADNAGEEVFDKLFIMQIRTLFPKINVYYFVRGKAIINDLTYQEAQASGLDKVATLVDSGVPTPGLAIELMNDEAKKIFESADCIIAKGMGNYECLSETPIYPVFHLLKVKCQVVARALNKEVGDIVCKEGS